ncbi:ABC transporter permease [Pseudonocardia sp. McavD-2-B]|uniref:ABC transporter permease n=2 Tax=unclassified Pseudonocardia TaxID=2619320 RepID=UPI0020983BF7|nr:ABC transporter permease [Pseudonocardia sp. McavD-2-B]MCO7192613.1 ABC transporter permease [Pseudonocardia sp. McavD-2-B]
MSAGVRPEHTRGTAAPRPDDDWAAAPLPRTGPSPSEAPARVRSASSTRPRSGPTARRPTSAPFGRLLRSELELALLRPRTAVVLAAVALVPLLATIALATDAGRLSFALGTLTVALSEPAAFALGMPVVLVAADAFAAERARGTLDALRLSPVGPGRLLGLKAAAVAVTSLLAAATTVVSALVCGGLALGAGPFGAGATVARALVLTGWAALQLCGLGMLLLAMSALVRRPAGVVATGLAALTVAPLATVLWEPIAPVLPSGHWHEVLAGVLAVPADPSALWATTARAAGFAVAGAGAVVFALTRRDG